MADTLFIINPHLLSFELQIYDSGINCIKHKVCSLDLLQFNDLKKGNSIDLTRVRDSLVARITACRVVDRGSIPRRGVCCANGLVVKSNVAIVGPPVRFRVCAYFFAFEQSL